MNDDLLLTIWEALQFGPFTFEDSGRLRYRARGVPSALAARLRSAWPDIEWLVCERAAIMEFDGRLARAEAERLALADVLDLALAVVRTRNGAARAQRTEAA